VDGFGILHLHNHLYYEIGFLYVLAIVACVAEPFDR